LSLLASYEIAKIFVAIKIFIEVKHILAGWSVLLLVL